MLLETIEIPVADLQLNSGQIPNVPTNPRTIRDGKFKKLMQSIKDAPQMLFLRELLVYPHKKKYVIIGGNMRFQACVELGYKTIPCKVLSPKVGPDLLKQIIMKDNIAYGETDWDLLANDWDEEDLKYWGLDIPSDWGTEPEEEPDPGDFKKPVVKLEILFDDLDVWQHAKEELTKLIKNYPGIEIKEPKGG